MNTNIKTARELHAEFRELLGPSLEPELKRNCIHQSDPNVRAYLSFDEFVFQFPTYAKQARRLIEIRSRITEVEIALLRIFRQENNIDSSDAA